MNKLLAAILALTLAALACVTPLTGTSSPANVETVVAQTMQALTSIASPAPVVTPTLLSGTSSLLPHSLYYLNNDSAGFLQVPRLEAVF